jgi:hypothetical protein
MLDVSEDRARRGAGELGRRLLESGEVVLNGGY